MAYTESQAFVEGLIHGGILYSYIQGGGGVGGGW